MAIGGKRILFFRNQKGMTQKQLGEILVFLGKTTDVCMTQYETEAQSCKKMANIFDVSTHALTMLDIDTYIGPICVGKYVRTEEQLKRKTETSIKIPCQYSVFISENQQGFSDAIDIIFSA